MAAKYRYPGTKPFSLDEHSIFFGRDEDIANLRTSVIVNATTVLFGTSGTGKSSIIQAGLIPLLTMSRMEETDEEDQIPYPLYRQLDISPKPFEDTRPLNTIPATPLNSIVPPPGTITDLPETLQPFNSITNPPETQQPSTTPAEERKTLMQTIYAIINRSIKTSTELLPALENRSYTEPLTANTEPFTANTVSLWYLLKQFQYEQAKAGLRQILLIIFDQAEELFTWPDYQIDELVQQLSPVIGQFIPGEFKKLITTEKKNLPADIINTLYAPIPVKFLFSIRSDKLHLITRLKKASPQLLQNSYELLPLTRAEAFAAIDNPSRLDGDFASAKFIIADNTKESIFSQLSSASDKQDYNFGEERIDPFSLQIVCSHIEQKIVPGDADKIIEKSELPDIQGIINGYYNDCINGLQATDAEKINVRNFIECRLISDSRRIPIHEALISSDDKYPVTEKILKMLVNAKILKRDMSPSGSGWIYEITHDSFIRPILEAKAQRLGSNMDDRSRDTIADLKKKIQEKESTRNIKDTTSDKSTTLSSLSSAILSSIPGVAKSTDDKRIPQPESSVSGTGVEDFALFDLYKKLGDAYAIVRDFNNAIDNFNKIISATDQNNKQFLIETYRSRSNAYYSLGLYDEAISDLKKILQLNNDDHTALNYLIDYADKLGRLQEAIDFIEKEAKISKDNAGIYTEIGNKFLAAKNYENARLFYNKTLEINPNDTNAYRNLGMVEEAGEHLDEAMKFYTRALELSLGQNEKPATNYNDIGNIYFAKNDFENARAQYDNAISHDPEFYYAYYNLGYLTERLNQTDEAIGYYNKALQINPKYDDALLGLTRIYLGRNDYEHTKESFLRMSKTSPTVEMYYYRLGSIEESFERWDEAINSYKDSIKANPNFIDALNNLSELYLRKNNFADAKDLCFRLITLEPEEEKTYRNRLGRIYYAQRLMPEAIAEYQHAIELDPTSSANYYNLGLAYKNLDPEKAIFYYRKALYLSPGDMDSRENLNALYLSLGRYEEAITECRDAIAIDPAAPGPHASLGKIYSRQGRFEEALKEYNTAIAMAPSDVTLISERANSFRHQDRFEEAIADFEHCDALDPVNPAWNNSLAYIYRTLGQYDKAIALFNKAIKLDATRVNNYTGLASVWFLMHNYEETIANVQQALKINEKSTIARSILAACYREQGLLSSSEEQIRLVDQFKAASDDNLYTRACVEALCANKAPAMDYLAQAISKGEISKTFARRDGDFYLYREAPEFKALVGEDPPPPHS
jgi:tetratricopeptide (TPR) repeat protein